MSLIQANSGEVSEFLSDAESLMSRPRCSSAKAVLAATMAVAGFALALAGRFAHWPTAQIDGLSADGSIVLARARSPSRSRPRRCLTAERFEVGEQIVWGKCSSAIASAVNESTTMSGCPAGWPWEALPETGGICRLSDGSGNWGCAPGWEQILPDGGCKTSDSDNSVTFRSANRSELCAERPEHVGRHGGSLFLEICRPRYIMQQVARNLCNQSRHSGSVVRFCPDNAESPAAGVTLFCFMAVMPDTSEVALQQAA